jgi:hypothetical protein
MEAKESGQSGFIPLPPFPCQLFCNRNVSPSEFKHLPPLVHRAVLIKLGWSDDYVDKVKIEIKSESDEVPFGRVGYIRNQTGRQEASGPRHGLFRRSDIARMLGKEWRDS